jgi:hypothetical protein
MSDPRADALRKQALDTLQALLDEAQNLFALTEDRRREAEAQNDEWARLYRDLSLSNASFPFAPYHNLYFENLSQPEEPLFHPIFDDISARYFELKPEFIDEMRERFVAPQVRGVGETFDRAKRLYVRAASEVAIVRRLSGYADLLAQLGDVLQKPWSVPIRVNANYSQRFPVWVASLNQATPIHRELEAIRSANVGTLRRVHDKLQGLIAILRSMIAELPYADMLKEPVSMPQTLILVQSNVDSSTTIGQDAKIEGSAVGQGSSKQGR